MGIGPERWTTGIRKLVNPEWTSTMLDYRLLPAPHNPDILDAVLPGDNDHDIDGNPRPAGMPADIGCFEVR